MGTVLYIKSVKCISKKKSDRNPDRTRTQVRMKKRQGDGRV